jgi:hypothetical protein
MAKKTTMSKQKPQPAKKTTKNPKSARRSDVNPLHKDGEHPAVGWARDAIHELKTFCERAEDGHIDTAYLDAADSNIAAARDELPKDDETPETDTMEFSDTDAG